MFKTRAALLGVLALLLVSGIATSTASAEGPYWRVNGARLGQGATKQLKLQVKGSVLFESKVTLMLMAVHCENAISEGGAIEGQGQFQGQDKGRLTLSQCLALFGTTFCPVDVPVVSKQLKSHLVTFSGGQKKYADLFEPQQGTSFMVFKISSCSNPAFVGEYNVTGSIAAEVVPAEVEAQEILLVFPVIPISEVFHEGQARKVSLKLGAEKAEITADFGARLATNERFGVFGT